MSHRNISPNKMEPDARRLCFLTTASEHRFITSVWHARHEQQLHLIKTSGIETCLVGMKRTASINFHFFIYGIEMCLVGMKRLFSRAHCVLASHLPAAGT